MQLLLLLCQETNLLIKSRKVQIGAHRKASLLARINNYYDFKKDLDRVPSWPLLAGLISNYQFCWEQETKLFTKKSEKRLVLKITNSTR